MHRALCADLLLGDDHQFCEGETVAVEAWIERRDVPGELLGYRPQYGFAEDTPFDIVKTAIVGLLDANARLRSAPSSSTK